MLNRTASFGARPPILNSPEELLVVLHGYMGHAGSARQCFFHANPNYTKRGREVVFLDAPIIKQVKNSSSRRQWFELPGYELGQPFVWPEESWSDLNQQATEFNNTLDDLLQQRNLSSQQLILMGFSQGGMLALHAGLRRAASPRAVIAMSCMLLIPSNYTCYERDVSSRPPVLLLHGGRDQIISSDQMIQTQRQLETLRVQTEFETVPNASHRMEQVCQMARIDKFLHGIAKPRSSSELNC